MTNTVDITIIGAGIIGLAVAAEVSKENRDVYILERNDTFGKETSSRNSEVIHSGIYYPKDSLKAKMCVEGKNRLYELCESHGIGYKRLGKLVVAINQRETENLKVLFNRGMENGVTDLSMLSKEELKELEPDVRGEAALFSPSTGIVDSYSLMGYFLNRARDRTAKVAYKSKVTGIERQSSVYKVTVETGPGFFSFFTRILINCAGNESDKVAALPGINISEAGYRLYPCKGEYFSLSNGRRTSIRHLIYPVDQLGGAGLGIHITLDMEGRIRLGPNARYVDRIEYSVDNSQKRSFYEAVKPFIPALEFDDLEPEMAGIRPKLQGPGMDFKDFVIRHEEDKGFPGLINLIGIESPGLTSSPAIAKYVGKIVNNIL